MTQDEDDECVILMQDEDDDCVILTSVQDEDDECVILMQDEDDDCVILSSFPPPRTMEEDTEERNDKEYYPPLR
jgi:hypothetical protein